MIDNTTKFSLRLKNMFRILGLFFLILFLFINGSFESYSNRCSDTLMLDGSEQLVSYGIDTTGVWWALTKPYSNSFRMTINGIQSEPLLDVRSFEISPDGDNWAFFGRDNTQWNIYTKDKKIPVPSTAEPTELRFSPSGKVLAYAYTESGLETIVYGDKKIKVYQRDGRFFLNYWGNRIAFTGYRSSKKTIVIEGKESQLFDDIIPIGFWYDNTFMYVGKNGNQWEIYQSEKNISEALKFIGDVSINRDGTCAAVTAGRFSNDMVAFLISDDYYEPLIGKPYDAIEGLVLHPFLPMLAYKARISSKELIVFSSTEYSGGSTFTGNPMFTHDGAELYFLGCDFDCFFNVSGQKFNLNESSMSNINYAKKPNNLTVAYSTSSALVVRYLQNKELVAGKMVDFTVQPIYNWRSGQYEALGVINNRLYKMVCKV